ncbi:MAG: SAM-dependent methyltransferase [Cytobacillus gottheilii]|uniref:SAM-dependent methyltransferase n=1 Tax=Cytobacillus gottheilii TaxID=859144 RepID=UPI00082E3F5C|nr:SAM-dependent methyltransferase [Cytobacillus gottheilii]
MLKEEQYEAKLNISTSDQQLSVISSFHYHRYEPTPYRALDELFKHYQLSPSDHLVDYGCGKGRLNFYTHFHFQNAATGIEMNKQFYQQALLNANSYKMKKAKSSGKIHFECTLAEDYKILPSQNRFYFFNPFTVQIFIKVVNNILLSAEESWRDIELIFYYIDSDYVDFLEKHPCFELKQEIDLSALFKKNQYERFLVYKLVL